MASIFGRSIIVPLTNKSGGGVVLGDVVVVDTTTDESFTTTTSAASTSAIGVAAETIANNAVGRVIVGGYASLVNVNASVTRNQFGTTHTVAKQAVASATRVAGTFCRWLKTSATPSAYIYPVDLAGTALTDPTSARGEIIRRGAAGLQALQAKTAGKALIGDGTDVVSDYPPGHEWDYVASTATTNITGTTEGGATTYITGNAVTFDGQPVMIEFVCPQALLPAGANGFMQLWLYEDGSSIGGFADAVSSGGSDYITLHPATRHTPSAGSHTYSIRASVSTTTGTPYLSGGAGGAGVRRPAFMRITKV